MNDELLDHLLAELSGKKDPLQLRLAQDIADLMDKYAPEFRAGHPIAMETVGVLGALGAVLLHPTPGPFKKIVKAVVDLGNTDPEFIAMLTNIPVPSAKTQKHLAEFGLDGAEIAARSQSGQEVI